MNELVVSCNLQGLAWKGLLICCEQLRFVARCTALELVVACNLQQLARRLDVEAIENVSKSWSHWVWVTE